MEAWYKIATPDKEVREGRSFNPDQFAIHIDPIPSATVILVREWEGQLNVYLMKRNVRSRFMPGMFVFPGGQVNTRDQDTAFWEKRIDLPRHVFEAHFCQDTTFSEALSHGVAAIRETAEESGVFLLSGNENAAGFPMAWPMESNVKDGREADVFRILSDSGKTLAFSRLHAWRRWITPKNMLKRFDTRFFLAWMPPEQTCFPDGRESVSDIWISPKAALAENLSGRIPLSPPTLVTLNQLAEFDSLGALADAMKDHRGWGAPLVPRCIKTDEGELLIEPWDPFYDCEKMDITPNRLESAILPVEAPFSRIWGRKGWYRPVAIT